MSLEVLNLTKIYGEQKAVNEVSFEARPGEILGFLGPNGAGKSTTMKIATGYLSPTEGTVRICGDDVRKSALKVRKHIGYLPEHNPLYLDMYVHEYLNFIGGLHGLKGKKLRNRASEMTELCGLEREQAKKIGALSKGYRQRVGLAQALIHDPRVLILDEPTTGLDPNQILEIRKVIEAQKKDKTVIFSTHILQEVQALCDKVVIINRGKVVANTKLKELKAEEGPEVLELEFSAAPEESRLQDIEGIIAVRKLRETVFEAEVSPEVNEKEVRKRLFSFAVDEGLSVSIELRPKSGGSLEEIFRKLTEG